jgi:hypothetical protein
MVWHRSLRKRPKVIPSATKLASANTVVGRGNLSPVLKREYGTSPVRYQTPDDVVEVVKNIPTVSEFVSV